ncbi:hypothetical protein AWB81_04189 [Caballeronia arationis]|uniref:hypothetical protein n=1 Tax=Caballeronia arationis TaxID=1777142 RepID=UPI00074CF35B|nr:hypothetical protein [Caballeronia arationis]SAK83230.1 hypothetical protein AWB81_04189 [Caballeronia arationis]
MSVAAEFIAGAEGLDVYPAGAIGNAFPWYQTNTAYQGQITQNAGAFNGNALAFAASAQNQSGMEYQFASTMQVLRSLAAAGGSGAFGFCGWIEIGTPVASGTDVLVALGSSTAAGPALPLLGLSYSATTGLNLVLPSTTTGLTNAPHYLAVQAGTYVWVGVYFSYAPTGALMATLCLAGSPIFKDVAVTFSTDIFSAGQIANRLKFYSAVTAPWQFDDLIVHAVSSADTNWPAPATLTPELIAQFTPRQISFATAVGNGSVTQFSASGNEPNWQSATDPTGANSVVSTAANQTDRYKWTTSATDIKAVIYRGASDKYTQLTAVQAVGGVQTNMGVTMSGPNEFIGISESDGSAAWTAASVNAAEFGQNSHN